MIAWYQILSCFLTNGIRIFFCLGLVSALLKLPKTTIRNSVLLSCSVSAVITAFSCFVPVQLFCLGIEIVLLLFIAQFLFQKETRMCLFVIFFYEIAVALWDFLVSSGIGVALHSNRFTDEGTTEYMAAVWGVRIVMIGIGVFLHKKDHLSDQGKFRFSALLALLGMFGAITLSEQNTILLSEDSLTTWLILSLILFLSVLFFYLNRQYEMEKEIAQLKAEQAELLERELKALNTSYATNAKLFHDLHNHIEILHCFLTQGKTADALLYLQDMQAPLQEMAQTVWTGDEAVDYLINSKITLAQRQQTRTKINIEFPRHTNIRSADLTAILGNLLDNALEATANLRQDDSFINLTIRRINDMLIIKVENNCEHAPVKSNGDIQTTKSGAGLHGWGLKSARTVVERYEGAIETTYEDKLFRTVVTLFYE